MPSHPEGLTGQQTTKTVIFFFPVGLYIHICSRLAADGSLRFNRFKARNILRSLRMELFYFRCCFPATKLKIQLASCEASPGGVSQNAILSDQIT